METLEELIARDARIDSIKHRLQQALWRSMNKQETLGLEDLGLKSETVDLRKKPRWDSAKRKARADSRKTDQKDPASSGFKPVPRFDDLAQRGWHPPTVPSYRPLPIPPLRNHDYVASNQPQQTFDPNTYRGPAPPVRYLPCLRFTSINRTSRAAQPATAQFSAIENPPRDFARNSANGSGTGPTVQKSSLSVSARHWVPPSRIDKQYRYSKAQASTDPKSAQLRWTGSLPTETQQGVPPTAKLPKTKEVENHVTGNATATKPKPKPRRSLRKKPDNNPLKHLPAPVPSPTYLILAHATPTMLWSPQRLLLVLDLNGTLLYRPKASQRYTSRPSLESFLKYAFVNHSVLIWSSATPPNVTGICARLFNSEQRQLLLGEWGRDTLGLTSAQYKERVQVYKRLDSIWDNEMLQYSHPGFNRGERWGQHNTMLIDDSILKASGQPYNHVEVPEFVKGGGEKEGDGKEVLAQVVGYLEEVRRWSDVSAFVRNMRFGIDEGWKWEFEGKRKRKWKRKQKQKQSQTEQVVEDEDEDREDDEDEDEDGGVTL